MDDLIKFDSLKKSLAGDVKTSDSLRNCVVGLMRGSLTEITAVEQLSAELGEEWLHSRDLNGNTLLHLALEHDSIFPQVMSIYQRTLSEEQLNKAISSKNSDFKTPLDLAVESSSQSTFKEIVEIYSKTGFFSSIEPNTDSVLHLAAAQRNPFFLLYLTEKEPLLKQRVKYRNRNKETIFCIAAKKGCSEVIDALLDLEHFEVNHQDIYGNTALHWAVKANSANTAVKLVLRGADKNIANKHGKIALDYAKSEEIRRILVPSGCFPALFGCSEELKRFKQSTKIVFLLFYILFFYLHKLVLVALESSSEFSMVVQCLTDSVLF